MSSTSVCVLEIVFAISKRIRREFWEGSSLISHTHTIHVDVGPGVLVASSVDAVVRAEKRPAEALPVV